jgi:hypothetical protein
VKPRTLIGFGVLACVPCCIGPIVAALGALAALGVASTVLIGGAGFAITAAAIAASVVVRYRARRAGNCSTNAGDAIEPVAVDVSPSRSSSR